MYFCRKKISKPQKIVRHLAAVCYFQNIEHDGPAKADEKLSQQITDRNSASEEITKKRKRKVSGKKLSLFLVLRVFSNEQMVRIHCV